jgi:unsaturated chondroitin disaccharide hydrolase
MNLELLFWASNNGGDSATLFNHSVSHASKTVRDFIRTDSSSYHIVRYNIADGTVYNKGTLQGQNDSSTWTRGQAWGVYSFTVCYRYTRQKQFLDKACAMADYFLRHLTPDNVSVWDFNAVPVYQNTKDASATAVVSSALFEIAGYINDATLKARYLQKAEDLLAALCAPPYLAEGQNTNAILLHSTQNLPSNQNIDKPIIFADYYFLEAITRYLALHPINVKHFTQSPGFKVGPYTGSGRNFILNGRLTGPYSLFAITSGGTKLSLRGSLHKDVK